MMVLILIVMIPVVWQPLVHLHLVPNIEVGYISSHHWVPLKRWDVVAHKDLWLTVLRKGGEELDDSVGELEIILRERSEEPHHDGEHVHQVISWLRKCYHI